MDSIPGGSATPAGGICTTCPHGRIEVIVWKHAICWDTPKDKWENAEDPGFEGVTVRINEVVDSTTTQPDGTQVPHYHALAEKKTDADGKVTFADLLPYSAYKVTASRHPDYAEVTQELAEAQHSAAQGNPPAPDQPGVAIGAKVQLRTEVAVEVGKTSYADLVLRKKKYRDNKDGTWTKGRECDRRHPASLWVGSGPGGTLGAILWDDEPGMLVARDWAWIFILVLVVGCAVAGTLGIPGYFPLFLGGILAAFAAYLTGVIWGEGPGTVAIAVALVIFAALAIVVIVFAVLVRMGSLTLSGIDMIMIPALFGILSGMWVAFALGYAESPPGTYQATPKWWSNSRLLGFTLIGAVIALVVLLVLSAIFAVSGMSPWTILVALIALIAAIFWCHHSALTGLTFKNEGEVKGEFGDTDYKLPYLGDRYCLQGAHGYWSHFATVPNAAEGAPEGAYDWALPDGTQVLCAKEGHIIAYYDQRLYQYYLPLQHPRDDVHQKTDGTDYEEDVSGTMAGANYIAVRHENGSVAFYAWLMTNGVTGKGWSPELKDKVGPGPYSMPAVGRGSPDATVRHSGGFNGIHVREGDVLGGSGWTDSDNPRTDKEFPNKPAWWTVGVGVLALAVGIIFVMVLGAIYNGKPPIHIGIGIDVATNSYCPPKADVKATLQSYGNPTTKDACKSTSNPLDCEGQFACATVRPSVNTIFHDDEGFDNQYCEALQDGWVKQPLATWSAPLGFGPLGLLFLIIYAWNGPNGKPYRNRMTSTLVYPFVLGLVIIINGPGSMIFHTTFIGGWSELDPCGMCLFTAYVSAYNIVRIANIPYGWFWLMFLGMMTLCVVLIYVIGGIPGADSTPVFAGSVGIAMLTQFFTVFVCKVITHRTGVYWFWGGLLVFGLAMAIWGLGHTGSPFCSTRGVATGFAWPHPVWHLLGAFAMFCFGISFIYQKDPEPCYPRLHLQALETPPPGPPLDDPEPADNGVRHNRYLTVKFQDGSTAIHANQPRSMRKYRSDNTPMRWHVMITPAAEFRPKDKGSHPVPIDGASGAGGSGAGASSSPTGAPSSPDTPPGIPSLPSMPGLPPVVLGFVFVGLFFRLLALK
jgi:hypothetical protein